MTNKSLGKKGENLAAKYLSNKGYKIVERNFRKQIGEIDLIVFDPEFSEYVFVEVKTRRKIELGYPEEFIDPKKLWKIESTAEAWLEKLNINRDHWRIDAISLEWSSEKPKITHLQNLSEE